MSDRRLRIAYVVHDYHRRGGQSRYVAELASRYQAEHEVHIFSNTLEPAATDRVTHHRVPAWRRNSLTTILSFLLSSTSAVHGPFDIVHAQGLCGWRQNVITAHMCQAGWFAAVDELQLPQSWRKRVFRQLITRLEAWAYRPSQARAVIAVSQQTADDLRQHYRVDPAKTVVIHHGLDLETFHPRNRLRDRSQVRRGIGLNDNEILALYVGDWQKAGMPLLQLLAGLPQLKLLVVTGTSHLAIQKEAAQRHVADRLLLFAPTPQIARIYAAADLFVFPSFYDTFGMVASEAMASGLPVVVSASAGVSEWIEHGVNGFVLREPWNAAEFISTVRALLEVRDLWERYGQLARSTAENHTWDRVAAETMEVYRKVLELPRS